MASSPCIDVAQKTMCVSYAVATHCNILQLRCHSVLIWRRTQACVNDASM